MWEEKGTETMAWISSLPRYSALPVGSSIDLSSSSTAGVSALQEAMASLQVPLEDLEVPVIM